MARVAILGAGFMGSALAVPAADNGHVVSLWGTHLDDHLIAPVRAGASHPKLGLVLPPAVKAFAFGELGTALADADLVVNAVTSDGAVPVLRRAAPFLRPGVPVLSVSKGLARTGGMVVRLSAAIAGATGLRIVSVGGPSKALELARRVPTAVVYASADGRARRRARAWLETPYYRIEESPDQPGLELCSALKNAYAIAIGLCDGLVAAGRAAALYNTKSALFAQALAEMARVGRTVRARPETVGGLGGAGDLHVTGMAGRNRLFGELRGAGRPTAEVVTTLRARDELTEGYAAIRWCWRYAVEHRVSGVPLLRALHRIVYGGRDVEHELRVSLSGSASRLARTPRDHRNTGRRNTGRRQPAGQVGGREEEKA
jgi:glycerol-3-phosphate dehydrogenase (NAD(P)+)